MSNTGSTNSDSESLPSTSSASQRKPVVKRLFLSPKKVLDKIKHKVGQKSQSKSTRESHTAVESLNSASKVSTHRRIKFPSLQLVGSPRKDAISSNSSEEVSRDEMSMEIEDTDLSDIPINRLKVTGADSASDFVSANEEASVEVSKITRRKK